ncbi:hypothetical protein [Fodinicola acaciae]|uniref:hypothetical protein n=1 Tax=Fodinicola acaciae TaxID=2681555 RepID=UPI0013D86DCC|nr:hypothetical protein [Fodinicola acaciae]
MTADFDSFTNRGEYIAAHYFADQLDTDLKRGIFDKWAVREGDKHDPRRTPRQLLRDLRGDYLSGKFRSYFAECADFDISEDAANSQNRLRLRTYNNPDWVGRLGEWHGKVLTALGFEAESTEPLTLSVRHAGRDNAVTVAWSGDGIVAIECGWAAVTDTTLDADGSGRLLHPLRISASEAYETGPALATWLFQSEIHDLGDVPPRFILLLCGGVIVLADRQAWSEGRFLAANLDAALERNDRRQLGELASIAALFSREMLAPSDDGKGSPIDAILKASRDNAVGVSGDLRDGLQRSVEIIANEVLARLDDAKISPRQIEDPKLAVEKELTRECLRYLYRILFLLYAEARPELGILPADDGTYEAGYSVARLRELVERDEQLVEEEARNGFHLFASLEVLFDKVNNGHRPYGTEADDVRLEDDEETRKLKEKLRSENRGLRFEPLRSELFEPKAIRLIGREVVDPRSEENGNVRHLDLRLRNSALHEVLRLLTMKKGARSGDRGGFISYRNLGINQLGAVYEGLMSYTGIIATEELCEVAKGGDPEKGSWLIPAHRQTAYPENTVVMYDEVDMRKGLRGPKRYKPGSFVYRLSGRDRETSASYYTPESLTKVTVELALKHRLDQEHDSDGNVIKTRASELLNYKICEPALGSGAFLNEAINQVAEEYLRRREGELGTSIPTAEALTEKQRVKAYIALHNAYGVDLNETGVELAEVSLWLNTMHPGMRAPWFGLHLRRGNSLIGARRAVYAGKDVFSKAKAWQKASDPLGPTPLPFLSDGNEQLLPTDAVHQFLLPTPGWAAVARSTEAKKLAPDETRTLGAWKKGLLHRPTTAQYARLRAAAKRIEFLWSLVVKRMELSEAAISRKIDVWGADPTDPEYSFLRQPDQPETKEKVFEDLFDAVDTPYWRLKTVMDAWCALWFWPADKAPLLDGSDTVYDSSLMPTGADSLSALLDNAPVLDSDELGNPHEFPSANATIPPTQESLFGSDLDVAPRNNESSVGRPQRQKNPPKSKRRLLRQHIPLKDLDDWLDFLEAMVGTSEVDADQLIEHFNSLDALKDYEDALPKFMGMDTMDPEQRFPWLHTVRNIAAEQGFLHWELEFALIFARTGGFDLQVGNPPWVRPRWNESEVFAEYEPWFELQEKASVREKESRRRELLQNPTAFGGALQELTTTSAHVGLFGSPQVYPLLVGTQPDLYRAFMCQTWTHSAPSGTGGLLHSDSHFYGDKEGALREAAYQRLRIHGDFVNSGQRFFPEPVGHATHFGVHIYGASKDVGFDHLSWLVSADALRFSGSHDGSGEVPGVRYRNAEFDERPHRTRVIRVDDRVLGVWQRLLGESDQPVTQARLLFPVSTAEASAIAALADYPLRLANHEMQISAGYHESGSKRVNIIDYNRRDELTGREYQPNHWKDVILKGPQLSVATPVFKRHDANSNDTYGADLVSLSVNFVPDTAYVRVASETRSYLAAQDRWINFKILNQLRVDSNVVARARSTIAEVEQIPEEDVAPEKVDEALVLRSRRRYTTFTRLAWRRMISPNSERALYAALFPPGPAHIHAIHSMAMPDNLQTAIVAGFWASLPLDYFLRTTGRGDLQVSGAKAMPAPGLVDHPLASSLLIRTLRLNCLTQAYSKLWAELYDPGWLRLEGWVCDWPGLGALQDVAAEWQPETPLRSERARRSALVEIDALVAVWVGMSADALIAAYRGRFPVLQKYEAATWFDADGWKIASYARTFGQRQTKASWVQFEAYREDPENVPPPDGYTAPFYKADREKEMREAHAVFKARLDAAVERGEWDPVKQEVSNA